MPRTQRSREHDIQAISSRLIDVLEGQLSLSMADAARALGYANATTLHKVKRGSVLPDFSRVAAFADQQGRRTGQMPNLHYILTGQGVPMLPYRAPESDQVKFSIDDDIINQLSDSEPATKQALLILLRHGKASHRRQR
ncbi:MAG: hypothetical protein E6Q50_14350 [Lysobacter sp.]|nr:MAG: hypothetical protein E6Q50_14350 [Lysobacter sp.]